MAPRQRESLLPTAVVSIAAGVLYALWLAPSYTLYDTAEFSWSGFTLAVSHPPGQPTFSVIGKLATLLPFGSVPFRIGLLSAIAGGLTAFLTGRLAVALADALHAVRGRGLISPLAACAVACVGPLVNQCTRVEVYSPTAPLFCLAALFGLRAVADHGSGQVGAVRSLAAAGLSSSLAATMHASMGIAGVLTCAATVLCARPSLVRSVRVWVAAVAGSVVGLSPLALVAVRCRPDVPCWDVMTPASFWSYVTGSAYSGNAQGGREALATVGSAAEFAVRTVGWLPMAVIGLALLAELLVRPRHAARRRRVLGLVVVIVTIFAPLVTLAVQPFYQANPDTQGYMLPTLVLLVAAAPVAAAIFAERLPARPALLGLVPLLLSSGATVAVSDAGLYQRARYWFPVELTEHAFGEMAPRAFVLTTSDHLYMAMRFGQLVQGARPDVALMVIGLAGSTRHWADVSRLHPDLSPTKLRRPRRHAPNREWGQAALDLARGHRPRYVESTTVQSEAARPRSTGVLFDLDGRTKVDARIPQAIQRELRRRWPIYQDGSERMLRLWRLERAWAREGWGELRPAADELVGALWEDRELPRLLRNVELSPSLRQRPRTPLLEKVWVTEPTIIRAVLARMLFQGRRTDLAIRVLERDYREGHPQSALALGEILIYEGRLDDAKAVYEAFEIAHPQYRGFARVGLALVRAARGDRAGAERVIRQTARGAKPVLRGWCSVGQRLLVPALTDAFRTRRDPPSPLAPPASAERCDGHEDLVPSTGRE